jgi:hypothetical protein
MGAGVGRQFPAPGLTTSEGRPSPSIKPLQPIQPIQPIQPLQPIQPTPAMPAMGAGQGFSFGDLHTMNIPGAPKLPQNPYADAAWWRQMYGPK